MLHGLSFLALLTARGVVLGNLQRVNRARFHIVVYLPTLYYSYSLLSCNVVRNATAAVELAAR